MRETFHCCPSGNLFSVTPLVGPRWPVPLPQDGADGTEQLQRKKKKKVHWPCIPEFHLLTRQPVANMKRFGGVRFGEMEMDCLLAHGAAANLHECLFTLSDSSQMDEPNMHL
ncbi:hypothetical protein Taro_052369 [Colocasia esculenta]|uniref:DNA-directed RNA polymerase n=1 Tax=Colocasia esculenta TaxID=4460 RepID=A0A843XJP2_COLES|nr:hypothetical protein [Colocasia esculenta]